MLSLFVSLKTLCFSKKEKHRKKKIAQLYKSIQPDSWKCHSIAKIRIARTRIWQQKEGWWRKRKSRRHQVEVLPKVHAHTEKAKQNKICHLPNLASFPRQASWTCRRLFWLAPCERAKISGLRSRGGPLP